MIKINLTDSLLDETVRLIIFSLFKIIFCVIKTDVLYHLS